MKNTSLILFTLLFSSPVWSADFDNGKTLHEENCVKCHDSSAYTRTQRRVNDLKQLGVQVRACKDNLGITWFDDEVDDVILYLNQQYYHF
jgi:cytochrome c2